ncbi:MAG TPA: hypothetical protein VIZ43_12215 [Trebonia sp.]
MVSDLGDAITRDPEVRQARMIADAARTRLLACMASSDGVVDLVEAQGMLDALRNARALAEDAEDRVLVHRGLLTSAEAQRRAVHRRPAAAPARVSAVVTPPPRQGTLIVAGALGLAAVGAVGVVVARRAGLRLPRGRR